MTVSFLVPMHDGARTVGAALDSILAQRPVEGGEILEVLVVDDGSTDGGAEVVRERATRDPRVRLIPRGACGGEAAALNAGLAEVRGDHVAIVEADVVLSPRWLSLLLPEVRRPGIGAVGGRLCIPAGEPWPARVAGYEVDWKMGTRPRVVPHVTSAASLYRWTAMASAGRFREDLRNASLDSEYNARIVRMGWRLRYVPEAIAWHRFKPTLGGLLARQYAYARYRTATPARWLYPRDRWVAARLAWLAALPVAAAAGVPGAAWGGIAAAGVLLHLPVPLHALRAYRDVRAALAAPWAGILRDVVALAGLAASWLAPPDPWDMARSKG